MTINLVAAIMGVVIGFGLSSALIPASKFKEYMESTTHNQTAGFRVLGTIWRILLPILFGFIGFLLPAKVLCIVMNESDLINELTTIYFYSFIASYFLCCFLLIKIGKVNIKKK
jgi:hypothetical protein